MTKIIIFCVLLLPITGCYAYPRLFPTTYEEEAPPKPKEEPTK